MNYHQYQHDEHPRHRLRIDSRVLIEWLPGLSLNTGVDLTDPYQSRDSDNVLKRLLDRDTLSGAWKILAYALEYESQRPGRATIYLMDQLDALTRSYATYDRGVVRGKWGSTRTLFLALAEIARQTYSRKLATVLHQFFMRKGRAIATSEKDLKLGQWGDALVRAQMKGEELVPCLREIILARPGITSREMSALYINTSYSKKFITHLEDVANCRDIDVDYYTNALPRHLRIGQQHHQQQQHHPARPSMMNRRAVSTSYLHDTMGRRGHHTDPSVPSLGSYPHSHRYDTVASLADTEERVDRIEFGLDMLNRIINKPTRDFHRHDNNSFDDRHFDLHV